MNNDVYLLSINPMGSRVEAIFEGRHRGESGKPGRIRYQQRCQTCQKWQLTQNHGCCHQETAWRVLPQLATWRKQNVHLPSTVYWFQPCWEVGLEALISGLIVKPSNEESSALSLGFQMGSWMSHLDAVVVPPSLVPTLCTGTSLCTQSWYLFLYSLVVPSMFGTK